MDDRRSKAFDFASESTKQVLSLSTGILGITITFSTDILKNADTMTKVFLGGAWIIYLFSIIFGVWTLLALTGTLEPTSKEGSGDFSIRGKNVTLPSVCQLASFLLGTIFLVAFAIIEIATIGG